MGPTPNRPFFANFFAAFRAQSAFQKTTSAAITTSTAATAQQTAPQHITTQPRSTSPSPSQARPITTKASSQTSQTAAAVAAHAFQAARSPPSTYRAPSASPPRSPGPAYTPPRSPPPRHGHSSFQRSRTPSQTRCAGARRSSIDSDSGGNPWKDAFAGGQNWYIGGRTAAGDERYYKLGMVKRYTSQDRLSLDRMSL